MHHVEGLGMCLFSALGVKDRRRRHAGLWSFLSGVCSFCNHYEISVMKYQCHCPWDKPISAQSVSETFLGCGSCLCCKLVSYLYKRFSVSLPNISIILLLTHYLLCVHLIFSMFDLMRSLGERPGKILHKILLVLYPRSLGVGQTTSY